MDDFGMVKEGQKWLVCLSGGKDSYTLLSLLLDLKSRGVLPVELLACNLDQAQPGFPQHILPEFFEKYDIPNRICLLYTSPSPRDQRGSRMPSSA